ncbi:MAG: phosphatidate cytidylyltransferase [Bdellovibrionales bacterium]|nr:phosphatidate cytidylyltransferase [Bdellovibrionales bacterium]
MWEQLFEPRFYETFALVWGAIFIFSVIFTILKKRSSAFISGLASSKSWLFLAPVIFLFCAMKWPYPLIFLCIISIYGAKNFFQMTGMYHRSNFVWACYILIVFAGYCVYTDMIEFYNLTPVMMLFLACMIPLMRNSYKHMVQYIALTLVNFCFIWALLHLGWIMKMHDGVYIFLYIILLTEFFDSLYLAISRYSKRVKLVSNITPKRSLEGFVLAGLVTLVLGWGMRHLLPVRTELYWGLLSFTCILFGSTGDTVLSVVRRDLGIKVTDSFILGRGDFFSRLDRFVFVAPFAYYVLHFLEEWA